MTRAILAGHAFGNRGPRWPFQPNWDSDQAKGLIFWHPSIGSNGRSFDLAGRRHHGAVSGPTRVTNPDDGTFGYSFDGSGGIIDCGDITDPRLEFRAEEEWSIVHRARFNDFLGDQRTLSSRWDGGNRQYITRAANAGGGNGRIEVWANGSQRIGSTGTISTARDYCIAVTNIPGSPNATLTAYAIDWETEAFNIDGETATWSGNDTIPNLIFGAINQGANDAMDGRIFETRIYYGRVLTRDDVLRQVQPQTRWELFQEGARSPTLVSVPAVVGGVTIDAETGVLTLSGVVADIQTGAGINADTAIITLDALDPTGFAGASITVDASTLTLNAPDADIQIGLAIDVTLSEITLSAVPPEFATGVSIQSEVSTLTLGALDPIISLGVAIDADSNALTLTALDAEIAAGPQPANIDVGTAVVTISAPNPPLVGALVQRQRSSVHYRKGVGHDSVRKEFVDVGRSNVSELSEG